MKKILTILILGQLTLSNAFAQDLKKIDYQIDIGTTLTIPYKKTSEKWPEIEGHPQTDYSSNIGYFLEFLISYNLNSTYSIGTGLNYNYNSLKVSDKIGLFENKGNITSSNLTLPIIFKYRISEKIPLSISAGTYASFLIGSNDKGTAYYDTTGIIFTDPNGDPLIPDIETEIEYDNNIKGDYTSMDFGLLFQLDYDFEIKTGLNGVIISRFNYGLINVVSDDLDNYNSASDWKNYNLLIGFGIKF